MTSSNKKPSVPDEVAKLVSAETFDIGELRLESFREEAHRSTAGALTFTLGKPGGIAQGIAIVTKKAAQVRAKLLIRRLGKATRFALPTPEFVAPELAAYLEPVHLIPGVDVSGPNPAGYLIPYRVSVWDGYETVFNALSKLRDPQQGLWLRYRRGT